MDQNCPRSQDSGENGHSICSAGRRFFAEAVERGRVSGDLAPPCLIRLQLLQPATDNPEVMVPVRPTTALSMLLNPIDREISDRQRQASELRCSLEGLDALYRSAFPDDDTVVALEGLAVINARIDEATAEARTELLTAQPGGGRSPEVLGSAMERIRVLIDRGVRIRTLYQHTARYDLATSAYVEAILETGKAEVKTLAELFERLIVFDRKVAFIPGSADRQVALEIRNPAIVDYLIGTFENAWQRAVPLAPRDECLSTAVIPEVQQSIAKLLVAGYVDEAIARRLGMSVRTCRGHIAKIAGRLGSSSRSQLGYLISTTHFLDDPTDLDAGTD